MACRPDVLEHLGGAHSHHAGIDPLTAQSIRPMVDTSIVLGSARNSFGMLDRQVAHFARNWPQKDRGGDGIKEVFPLAVLGHSDSWDPLQ
jgi:hypothetical protein